MQNALIITHDDSTAADLRAAMTPMRRRRMLALALVLEGYKRGLNL